MTDPSVCDITGLPVDECLCYRHGPTPAEDATIEARFTSPRDGYCDACGFHFESGDRVARTSNGDLLCESCSW